MNWHEVISRKYSWMQNKPSAKRVHITCYLKKSLLRYNSHRHTTHSFKMHNSTAFSTFRVAQPLLRFQNTFIIPGGNSVPISSHFSFTPRVYSSPRQTRIYYFQPLRCAYSEHSVWEGRGNEEGLIFPSLWNETWER